MTVPWEIIIKVAFALFQQADEIIRMVRENCEEGKDNIEELIAKNGLDRLARDTADRAAEWQD